MRRRETFAWVLLSVGLLLASIPAAAVSITPDGQVDDWDPPGWIFDPPPFDNLGHIGRSPAFTGEYIWRDQPADERNDFTDPARDTRVDLLEVRLTGDLNGFYALARFADIPTGAVAGDGAPMLQIAVSTPSVALPDTWFAGFADTWVPPVAGWTFLIQTRFGGAVAGSPDLAMAPVMLYTPGGGSALAGTAVISAQTDAIEIAIPWAALGMAEPPDGPALFTVATFRANPADNTWDLGGPNVPNALDAVTNYGDPGLAMENTWREVQDMVVDYHFEVLFGRGGEVSSPLVIHEVSYDPVGPDPALEYVELVNATAHPLALAGFRLGDAELLDDAAEGMAELDCGTLLPFGSLVVASSADDFAASFGFAPDYSLAPTALAVPVALPYDLWATGSVALANDGDELLVVDAYDTVIDLALFETLPWPAHAGEAFEALEGQMMWRFQLADTNDMLADFMPFAPSPEPELCGNGIVECLEACDDGAANGSLPCGCRLDCSMPTDGDPCEDGLYCNGAETCGGGACNPGPAPCTASQICMEGSGACVEIAGSLVVNEIDYDQPGNNDPAEFVELRNNAGVDLELAGFSVVLVNGNGGGAVSYDTIALPDAILAAGDYFVICANAATVANCDLDDGPDTNFIQNGAPDAVAVLYGGAVVDAVSYEGNTGAPYTETTGVDPGDDNTTASLGISRYPDGADTDVNDTDLSPRCISPGGPNHAAAAGCLCGNGLSDPGEICDDGGLNGTTTCGCTLACDYPPASTPCLDGLFCNGDEHCNGAGACVGGALVTCADGVACTDDVCNEDTDLCENPPDDSLCDDGLVCDGAESCDPTAGCVAGTPITCDDGVGCTTDTCSDIAGGCVFAPDDAACDDGALCTLDACDPLAGCENQPIVCGDGVGCTVDGCNPATGNCEYVPDDGLCDDGDACTGVESCDAGVGCLAGTPVVCDDLVGCTLDACDPATGACVFSPDDGACDNGLFCDGQEFCDGLLDCLTGMGVMCDDGVGCTLDQCDEELDDCAFSVDDAACDDGLPCNGAETCDPLASCQAGTPVDCSGLDGECVVGVCEAATGACQTQDRDDGTECSDGDVCTAGDVCGAGACAGTIVDADGDEYGPDPACGDDCDDADASIHPNATETCDDGIDQDCSGADLACGCADADGDTFPDTTCGGTDCNDADAAIHPGAEEICGDGVDQDCSGGDETCPCPDGDGDSHQDATCGGDDCDDADAAINPGAAEVCGDSIDQDCSGADLACGCADADGDGHQDLACGGDDCDDSAVGVHPGAQETCGDGIDQDCSGGDLSCGCADADDDGYPEATCGGTDCDDADAEINPAADEACSDGVDNNCDGLTDAEDPRCGATSSGCDCGTSGSPAEAGLAALALGLAVLLRRRSR